MTHGEGEKTVLRQGCYIKNGLPNKNQQKHMEEFWLSAIGKMIEMLRKSHSRPKIEAGTALPHVPGPSRTLARHRTAIIRNLPLGKGYTF